MKATKVKATKQNIENAKSIKARNKPSLKRNSR